MTRDKEVQNDNSSKEESMQLVVVITKKNEEERNIVENILPLAMHTDNQIEYSNKNKICMVEEDLECTIDKISI